jgi:hypothetical protein
MSKIIELDIKEFKHKAKEKGLISKTEQPSQEYMPFKLSWPQPLKDVAYQGTAGMVTELIAPHTESDNAALLLQFLVAFGNIIGRSARFTVSGCDHYLNLFACLVGKTSSGRKGTSWEPIERLFKSVDPTWASRIMSGLSSGEGLIWAVHDPIEKTEPVKEKGRVVEYQKVIVDTGVEDKRLLVVETEFASVLRVLQRDGNILSAIIREAWDKGDLRVITKNTPAQATQAHISIIGHITPDELRRYIDRTELGNGFANRFLWVCVKRSKLLPDGGELHNVDFEPIVKILVKTIEFAKSCSELKRHSEATELWQKVYANLSREKAGLFGSATSRAAPQVLRLACLYALLDCSHLIKQQHLEAALEIWRYCEDSAKYIFGDSMGDPLTDEILKALVDVGEEGLTKSFIIEQLFKRNHSASRINNSLVNLVESQLAYCQKETTSERGRPAEKWFSVEVKPQPTNQSGYEENELNEENKLLMHNA